MVFLYHFYALILKIIFLKIKKNIILILLWMKSTLKSNRNNTLKQDGNGCFLKLFFLKNIYIEIIYIFYFLKFIFNTNTTKRLKNTKKLFETKNKWIFTKTFSNHKNKQNLGLIRNRRKRKRTLRTCMACNFSHHMKEKLHLL